MTFEQALKAMREGKKVWHKGFDQSMCWKENSYLAIVNGRITFFEEGKPSVNYPDFHFNIFESPFILGNDWEICGDTPTDETIVPGVGRYYKDQFGAVEIDELAQKSTKTVTFTTRLDLKDVKFVPDDKNRYWIIVETPLSRFNEEYIKKITEIKATFELTGGD
jgi:hypothetical protein